MIKEPKERLLEAAIKVFARDGFEGGTTRQLAKEAGVNISAIPYYFDNKDGLYEAVIRRIISVMLAECEQSLSSTAAALATENLTATVARERLHDFLSHFATFLLGEKASPDMAQIIMREQMRPTALFDIIYTQAIFPIHQMLTKLIAHLTGLTAEGQEAILCTHMIIGQLMSFKTHKEMVCRRSNWKGYGEKETQAIISALLRHTEAIIASYQIKD